MEAGSETAKNILIYVVTIQANVFETRNQRRTLGQMTTLKAKEKVQYKDLFKTEY